MPTPTPTPWSRLGRACVCTALLAALVPATDYYVRPSGDDANPGTSPALAWRTLARVSSAELEPGDRVLLEAGAVFRGSLFLGPEDAGSAVAPVVVTSFGGGRAIIDSGDAYGLLAYRCGGLEIRELVLRGSGAASNGGSGIELYNDSPTGAVLDHVWLSGLSVSGYGAAGVSVLGWQHAASGYRDVRIVGVNAFDNRHAGIQVQGYWDLTSAAWAHHDLYIAWCNAYRNAGDPALQRVTGSGIVVSETDGCVIEHCQAFENGALNRYANRGPAGIWAWHANDVTIQLNVAHHNHSGSLADGGGFAFDGGVTNSWMQYNYAYENDGPGLLLAQFAGAPTNRGNTYRYNVSHDDSRKNPAGALTIWCSAGASMTGSEFYGNSISLSPAPKTPPAVKIGGLSISDVKLRNNLLITSGGLAVVDGRPFSGLLFQGNAYWSSGAPLQIRWSDNGYADLASWRAATGQETLAGSPVGIDTDPRITGGPPQRVTSPSLRYTVGTFQPDPNSPLVDTGLDLQALFGTDMGPHDFALRELRAGNGVDIGAIESSPNLVCDSGFEFDPEPWSALGNTVIATGGAAFGGHALQLGPGAAVRLQEVRGLAAGGRYQVSAYGRATSAGVAGLFGIAFLDPLGGLIDGRLVTQTALEYQRASFDVVAPAGFDRVWVFFLTTSTSGAYLTDGVAVDARTGP